MSDVFNELMHGLDEVEGFLTGNKTGFKVHVPEAIDVKQIRSRLKMTQSRFSDASGFSLDAVKHWEGGRRNPEVAARAYLTVIAKNPSAVIDALGATSGGHRIKAANAPSVKVARVKSRHKSSNRIAARRG